MPGDLVAQMRPYQQLPQYIPCNTFYNICTRFQQASTSSASRDETDNNTHNEFSDIGQLKPRYVMDDRFHREDERLKTFENWPLEFLDRNELARSGMFYMGESDKTKCYFCEVEIGRWEPNDVPVPEHLRFSPNCPLLRRRTTNNVPINAELLERLLPAPSYDICGANDIEIRRNAFAEGTIPATHRVVGDVLPPTTPTSMLVDPNMFRSDIGPSSATTTTSTFFPEVPEYAIETARLRSFAEWPRNMKQRPEQLAEAGFFYTGVGDRVKCFSCGGGLKDWDDDDEPWEQHALWMRKCRFVKLMKGESYIESIVNKFKKPQVPCPESNATASVASSSSSSSSSSDEERETSASGGAMEEESTQQAKFPATASENTSHSNSQSTDPPASSIATRIHQKACSQQAAPLEPVKPCSSVPQEEKLCKICYVNEYNTAFLPCGHVVACAKCASSVTKCPMCRKPFVDVMRVYFS
uniref:Putative death-associated inhibitor of apoptosis 1 n=2 Tax=Haematobia irritans TaxID=7368 RepID=A0A1L8EIW0_HAEIR